MQYTLNRVSYGLFFTGGGGGEGELYVSASLKHRHLGGSGGMLPKKKIYFRISEITFQACPDQKLVLRGCG